MNPLDYLLNYVKSKSTNVYRNRLLQFKIEKPADWVFVPQKWAYQFNVTHKWQINKLNKVLSQGVLTFVYFYKRLKNKDYPCPTVQCGCRINHLSPNASREEQLEQVIREITQPLSSWEIIEKDPDYMISGHRGMMVLMKFTIPNDTKKIFNCISRTYFVEYHEYLITIGMTGSDTREFRFEKEFQQILQSIEIGK